MKKYFLFISLFCSYFLIGQNITDALRFSQNDLTGTARFTAMSGAFGALGGDFSAFNLNPAGSTVFLNNQAGFTLRSFNVNNKANYFGTKNSQIESSIDLNQAGAVFVFENAGKSDWSKIAIGVNYENVANFDNSVFSQGTGSNSLGNYFLSYANGIPLNNLQNNFFEDLTFSEQQGFLGYQGFVVDPITNTPGNTVYVSNVPSGVNYLQQNEYVTGGFNGKLTLNGAVKYKDIFSVGLNINTHFVDYRQSTSFYERNDFNATSTTYNIEQLRFSNDLYTYGSGASLQVGTILKPIKELRIGLAYQSPTWYRLNDETSQRLTAVSGNVNETLATDIVDPGVTLIYEPYKVRTAGNFTGSLAYVAGKKGLISFDYILRNHENISLGPDNNFANQNAFISNVLKNAAEYRIGGEYKIQKFSLRGGYRFEESPYEDGKTIGNLTGYSGGLGYNFGRTKLDAAYSYSQRFYNQQFFNQGFTDFSSVNTKNHSVSVSLLFEL